eukprot:1400403-Prorocentrum_lima.AAC.1
METGPAIRLGHMGPAQTLTTPPAVQHNSDPAAPGRPPPPQGELSQPQLPEPGRSSTAGDG